MVSWAAANGKLAGYSGASGKLVPDAYTFASPGTVDLNGATRLHYILLGASSATFPNKLTATATFTFVSGDFTANPGKKLSAAMFLAPASAFAAGVVPTPAEILALGSALSVYRADVYVTIPKTQLFNFTGPIANNDTFQPNSKYWVLILPTALANSNSPWNAANDVPMSNIAVNTMGRAMSVWTNRTPAAPTITSPVTGIIAASGEIIQFTYSTDDPDKTTPVDAGKRNLDLAGVQIQYAPVPVPGGPQPEWRDLPFTNSFGGTISSAWYIRGADYNLGSFNYAGLVDDLGVPIVCGAQELQGHATLAGGNWQLRCRVFDFGHPYPNAYDALGHAPAGDFHGGYTPTTYPALNTSPWSEPVTVIVPTQVPPPIPISPTSDLARLDGNTVRLSWQYRNTFTPPYPQARRWIQIHERGATEWSTVFAGNGSDPYVDLLPVNIAPPPVASTEYQTDLGWEGGTLADWEAVPDPLPDPSWPPQPSPVVTNVNNSGEAHSGNRYLRLDYAGLGFPSFATSYEVNPEHDTFTLRGWVFPNAGAEIVQYGWRWQDEFGEFIGDPEVILVERPSDGWGWVEVEFAPFSRPEGGVYLYVVVLPFGFISSGMTGARIDDWSFVGLSSTNTVDFEIEATHNYEWRVRTEDESGSQSDYSLPASFWVIPGPGTGPARPLPTETIDGATLGCGKHSAYIYRRGGTRRVGEVKGISYLDWGRVRDDISTSKIIVNDWDIDCGNLLSKLQCWAYELVIFRDNGLSVDRVWEGPITLLTYEQDSVTIHAKDVMGYAYRRIIKQIMNDTAVGDTVVSRAARVLQNAFAPDDPNVLAYLTVLARDDDAVEYRSIPAYSRTAFEEVDDMAANSGLDYAAIGRAITLWGTKHRIGTLPEFRDNDLGSPPIVSEYGMSMANRYVVSDGNGVWGEATRLDVSGNDENYGLVEMLSSSWASDSQEDSGTYTQAGLATVVASFEGYAERSISDRYMPGSPVVVRIPDNTTINPSASISIQQLVPGVVVPLRSTGTLRKVVASQKLDSVMVVEQSGKETISITLSPFSRDDASADEGEEL